MRYLPYEGFVNNLIYSTTLGMCFSTLKSHVRLRYKSRFYVKDGKSCKALSYYYTSYMLVSRTVTSISLMNCLFARSTQRVLGVPPPHLWSCVQYWQSSTACNHIQRMLAGTPLPVHCTVAISVEVLEDTLFEGDMKPWSLLLLRAIRHLPILSVATIPCFEALLSRGNDA